MIYLVIGRPGDGKGMYLAYVAEQAMRSGRPLYADFWLQGARPWLEWADIATPAHRGAVHLADELGASFSSRGTLDLDPLVFTATTLHRKQTTDVFGCAQHLGFVDIQFRRLCHVVIVVRRIGPDGGPALMGATLRFWRHPWFFVARHYHVDDFDDKGDLRPLVNPFRVERFMWTSRRAALYDTSQILIPPDLIERWRLLCESAYVRSQLPVMRRDLELSDVVLDDVVLPDRVSGRETKRSRSVDARSVALSRGFYVDSEYLRVVAGASATPTSDTTISVLGEVQS